MSAITLLPYAKTCFLDRPRFKAIMWARGVRKTFTVTLEIVDECFAAESQGGRTMWLIVSRGERQSLEAMREVKRHCRAYSLVASDIEERDVWSEAEGRAFKVYEIHTPGGSRIIGLPANPDTIRGYTSNVYLDEFAMHPDSRELWQAIYPVLRGRLRMIVSSTPKGKGNKFYEIMTAQDQVWSRHVVDIYEAVRQGLPFDIEVERQALADPDGWAQEYELKWLDEATAWLSYELIQSAEHPEAGIPALYEQSRGICYVGMDIARRRDLTVIWVLERSGDVLWTREVVSLKNQSFAAQEAELARVMRYYRVGRLCMDQTGMGEVMVERAKQIYGDYVVEGCLFTGALKQDLATTGRQKFEDQLLRIPAEQAIRESHHAVRKIMTAAGNPRFDADRSEVGHADEFWAHMLAIHAADNPAMSYEYQGLGRTPAGMWGAAPAEITSEGWGTVSGGIDWGVL